MTTTVSPWKKMLNRGNKAHKSQSEASPAEASHDQPKPEKWSLGVLNDRETDEVPGSILLLSKSNRNEPLGLRNAPARTSASSLPSPFPPTARPPAVRNDSTYSAVSMEEEQKKTKDGAIILNPQPDDSKNDPLNWPALRRDLALLSIGFYSMVGGGMTPALAAGFQNVADSYNVTIPQVALTTGLYMMGLGLGSVIASPTAILYGKRPVYLVGIVLFVLTSIWCALSPTYSSLVIARIVMGFAVSPIECLPSASIAEIYFLHERAYRLGVYTLLLLGGKNLVPLVSAAIINSLSWQWVFWIVAMISGFSGIMLFLFVPETFWDRTPVPKKKKHRRPKSPFESVANFFHHGHHSPYEEKHTIKFADPSEATSARLDLNNAKSTVEDVPTIAERRQQRAKHHVGFAEDVEHRDEHDSDEKSSTAVGSDTQADKLPSDESDPEKADAIQHEDTSGEHPADHDPHTKTTSEEPPRLPIPRNPSSQSLTHYRTTTLSRSATPSSLPPTPYPTKHHYTAHRRTLPPLTFSQTLRPWNGRLTPASWPRVAIRPFILFAYPSILWSTLVYSLSVGWLIVLSESVSSIYRNKESYNFSALGTGLVYLSPFIGGILGTAVAGKVSDIIVRYMARKNGGVYEPEFRLVMAIPVTLTTCIGLMGFGWSAEERDKWIVPTIFFGVISFGCSLGSTTAITFAVDSYRQYAGEALVTLNFSKNILHGLVFSLFFNHWLEAEGSKKVFLAIGGIQLACLMSTVPVYVWGKRARMWTVRKNFMEKF